MPGDRAQRDRAARAERLRDLVGDLTRNFGDYGLLTAACRVRGGCARAGLSTRLPKLASQGRGGRFVIAALAVLVVAAPSLSIAGAGFLLVYLMVGLQGPVGRPAAQPRRLLRARHDDVGGEPGPSSRWRGGQHHGRCARGGVSGLIGGSVSWQPRGWSQP